MHQVVIGVQPDDEPLPPPAVIPIPQDEPEQHNIGTYLARRIQELGAEHYFVVPGDFNLTLLDQFLKNEELQMIGCCNELNAGYAADGYARSSPKRVAVVVVTFMVGGLSLINAIAGAYSENLSVVVISGCPRAALLAEKAPIHHTLGKKDRDQPLRMFGDVTATSVRLNRSNPTEQIDKTLQECRAKSLPVYIEIPDDMATLTCGPPMPLEGLSPSRPLLTTKNHASRTCEEVVCNWKQAKRPVLIIGARARHALSRPAIASLVEKLGCPVFCQPDAKSIAPENHPNFMGTFWAAASDNKCRDIVQTSDLWIILGGRWTDYHTTAGALNLKKESYRIIDIQPNHAAMPGGLLLNNVALEDVIHCLVQSDLQPNGAALPDTSPSPTISGPPAITNVVEMAAPLTMATIMTGIQHLLTPRDTLLVETGDSWFSSQQVRMPDGADFQMQMLYGSIGWSLPATLGSQLAHSEGRSVLMIGDGSFQMTAQELSTMIRLRINPIIFIINNLGYQIECAIHDGPYNYFTNWNYTMLAKAMSNVDHAGGNPNPYATAEEWQQQSNPAMFAMQIRTPGDLYLALQRARQEPEKLALLECCIQPNDVSDMLLRFGDAIGKPYVNAQPAGETGVVSVVANGVNGSGPIEGKVKRLEHGICTGR